MVIGVRPERLEEYRELHADSHPGVRDLLHAAHMRNFLHLPAAAAGRPPLPVRILRVRRHRLRGGHGQTGAEPRNREWLARCGPMQIPLPGEPTWKQMERVYYNP